MFTCRIQFLLWLLFIQDWGYIQFFSISVFVVSSVQMYPAVFLSHFISAAVILLASLALMVKFSLPYDKGGRTSVLYCIV